VIKKGKEQVTLAIHDTTPAKQSERFAHWGGMAKTVVSKGGPKMLEKCLEGGDEHAREKKESRNIQKSGGWGPSHE